MSGVVPPPGSEVSPGLSRRANNETDALSKTNTACMGRVFLWFVKGSLFVLILALCIPLVDRPRDQSQRMIVKEKYSELLSILKRIYSISSALDLLQWDEQVNLPSGDSAASKRADQLVVLSELLHNEATTKQIGALLSEIEQHLDEFSFEEKVVVRETRRDYDRLVRLPASFVSRKAAAESASYHAWAEARKKNDFSIFEPHLQKMLDLSFEEASLQGFEGRAYDYKLDCFDPGLTTERVVQLFDDLKVGYLPLVQKVLSSTRMANQANDDMFVGFPEEKQRILLDEVTKKMGFDYNRGRLDVSLHPFTAGDGSDIRMTTRYDKDSALGSLYSAIHEAGHGIYEQGQPLAHRGTALCEAVGMAVHESQSRIWENQVGRSSEFWAFWEPRFRELFPEQLKEISHDQLLLGVRAVKLCPIRVESDELTYNLHIMLRFEIERRLFSREIKVSDVPSEWNRLSQEIVGLTPENDATGCLQDIHWSGGMFGYFPSYCIGNMIAAQLWETVQKQVPELMKLVERGEYSEFREWLRVNVHSLGKQYNTNDLVLRVCGEPLSPSALLTYLESRYVPLYST